MSVNLPYSLFTFHYTSLIAFLALCLPLEINLQNFFFHFLLWNFFFSKEIFYCKIYYVYARRYSQDRLFIVVFEQDMRFSFTFKKSLDSLDPWSMWLIITCEFVRFFFFYNKVSPSPSLLSHNNERILQKLWCTTHYYLSQDSNSDDQLNNKLIENH